jgi:hypothetical protein
MKIILLLSLFLFTGCLVTNYSEPVYPANPEEAVFVKTVYQTQVVITNPYVAQKFYNTGSPALQQQYVKKKLKEKQIVLPPR